MLRETVQIEEKRQISEPAMDHDVIVAQSRRSAIVYLGMIGLAAWLALYARQYALAHPSSAVDLVGDGLWALLVFAAIGLFFPTISSWQAASLAFIIPALLEVGHLYHVPWLDPIRGTSIGLVVLGTKSIMADFACYAAGALVGMGVELFALE
jgi:hypothetical protein